MKITLKDGSIREYSQAMSAMAIAKDLSEGLARVALIARVNGNLVDLSAVISEDSTIEFLTFDSDEGKNAYRHTTAHVLAMAVKNIYPTVKLAIGPSIANGFYYDFDFKSQISMDDIEKIEKEMQQIIKADLPIVRSEVSKRTAQTKMRALGEEYKLQLINEQPAGSKISFYQQGDFIDMCRGPHLPSTGKIKAFKLTQLAGAYWKGDEKNKMLTRVYGTAFDKKADLEQYIFQLEDAKRRDHNKLGRELEFFTTIPEIGQGLPVLLPKGARVIQLLQRFVEDEEQKRGYLLTKTPLFAKSDFYKISGHWDHYRDGMFVMGDEEKDDEVFALRPMTCPFQFQAYLNRPRSYRDLPLRYNETSTLFRNESSGEMHGLIRVRQFTISEGHLACRPDQVENEFKGCLDLAKYMLTCLGLQGDVSYRFSKWDEKNKEKYIGNKEEWESVQNMMRDILNHLEIDFTEADGEAAFYGPKLDIQMKNVFGKEDTIITIQIDFQLAHRFKMEYVDADGVKKNPYVIHRTSIGCYERTLALLIEKYAGALPLWIAPVQAIILPVSERFADYCDEVKNTLLNSGLRIDLDNRNEKIGYKIREAQLEKIPYMLVIGEKEKEAGLVSVRSRKEGDLGAMTLEVFLTKINQEISDKT